MKRLALLATVALAVAVGGAATASNQGAGPVADVAQVTIVHAATFDAADPLPVTVCAGGALVDDDFQVGEQLGPIPVPAGPLTADVYLGAGESCGAEGTGDITATLDIAEGDDIVVVAAWTDTPRLLTYDRPQIDCVEPGNAAVAAFHAADVGIVDVYASPAGDAPSPPPAIPDFEEDTFAGPLEVPAATVDFAIFEQGADPSGQPAVAVPGVTLAEGTLTTVYAIGGQDGDAGAFALVDDVGVCVTPVEPTTPTTEPPAVAPADAAQPVAASPTFTG